jgi:hypothetical protein
MKTMWAIFLLVIASSVGCQQLPLNYSAKLTAGDGAGMCPDTQDLRETIQQDIRSLINSNVLSALGTGSGYGACGCGGPGWRRAAYLNMSDPTQTCPPAWELITTPRRSCARPSDGGGVTCYSALFPTQGIQYSQVCGRIIGYQVGETGAFVASERDTINNRYVDGVSLTYGNPQQHIWTFANALDEYPDYYQHKCPCTNVTEQRPIMVPSFIGNDYFCETGVPPGQQHIDAVFYADDPLWDGQGCGPTSTCCTFNNPPWFCKQLLQSTIADLEVRLCSANNAALENTPIQLIEIYVK